VVLCDAGAVFEHAPSVMAIAAMMNVAAAVHICGDRLGRSMGTKVRHPA
jgi:hypothetical protein